VVRSYLALAVKMDSRLRGNDAARRSTSYGWRLTP